MMDQTQQSTDLKVSRFLPLLLILFAGGGCAALIYEIVWYQLLQLVIGSTAVSLGVLLATFMGGLCLGSLALPRILCLQRAASTARTRATRRQHPLRVYAAIELGVGICGILVLFGMPFVDRVYIAAVGYGLPGILLRAVTCAVCLLPPTFLMGASLPAIAPWVESTPRGVTWLGLLYGANTVGAVLGCLLAGFYLLRVFDMATATYAAAAINAAVAAGAFGLATWAPQPTAEKGSPREGAAADPHSSLGSSRLMRAGLMGSGPVYMTIALSGATALGAEVVWTRLLGLMLGATVYTFSIILAVFLAGLGLGSGAGSLMSSVVRPRTAIGICHLLLAAAIAWTAFTLARSLPYWPINTELSTSPWFTFQVDLVRVIWAILPATVLWGMSFPLALAAVASRDDDPAHLVGSVYAANTGGAILGALAFSMVLIPWVGTRHSQSVLIALASVSALCALEPVVWSLRAKGGAVWLAAAVVAAGFLAAFVPTMPPSLIAYGRRFSTMDGTSDVFYVGEGLNSSIAISQYNDILQFHVSGKVEASTAATDMRLQRMLGHLPALVNPKPRSVLIVGFGAGVTAGTFVLQPDMQRIVICEMERLIPPVATQYFAEQNYNVLHDRRTEMVYDDARHFVLTTPEKFDIITSDPIHPWVKGSATLYTKEYFELVKEHLNPGGVVTQWVPLYETDPATVKSEVATFFDVFPNGTIWANEATANGGGYDVLLLGQAGPTKIDVDELQRRMDLPEYARVTQSLRDVGLGSAVELLKTYAGQDADLGPWLKGAAINRDGNLRLQYLAGLAVNDSQEDAIYNGILRYRSFPANLLTGSDASLQPLRDRFRPK
jgi:spermidine synthase